MYTEVVQIHTKTSQVNLYPYFLDNTPELDMNRKRPVVLVCPGGGYEFTSDREAEPIALQMCARGFHACVLRYSVKPARFPQALTELACTVAWLREHAEQYGLDADRIIVCGFSAGGHLTASLGTFWNRDFLKEETGLDSALVRPNGLILCYPVITSGPFAHRGSFDSLLRERAQDPQALELVSLEKQVTEQMPPVFLWHTFSDDLVPVENTLLMADALRRAQIPFELHIYPSGVHGLSLATEETDNGTGVMLQPECSAWIAQAADWIHRDMR